MSNRSNNNRGKRGGGGGGRNNRSPQNNRTQNSPQHNPPKNPEYELEDPESEDASPDPEPIKSKPNPGNKPANTNPPQKKGPPPKNQQQPQNSKKPNPQNSKTPTKADQSQDSSSLSSSTSGLFQFGQPVHGFTPMSFNFSLPTGTDAIPVAGDSELPSHSGPCVVTTGGVTFSLDQVASQTLEEDEEAIFSNKAKLYRYDFESKEWKERGVGDYKILKHKLSGKHRILMRRDKILKICANHVVSPIFNLKSHETFPETCWIYQTDSDFSDEVIKQFTFAVRFKTPEIAKEFKQAYETSQSEMQKLPPSTTEKIPTKPAQPQQQPQHPPQKQPSPQVSSPPQNNNSSIKVNELTIENAHPEAKKVAGDQSKIPSSNPSSPPLTLGVLYDEIKEINATLKTMREEWTELKNIILASNKK